MDLETDGRWEGWREVGAGGGQWGLGGRWRVVGASGGQWGWGGDVEGSGGWWKQETEAEKTGSWLSLSERAPD